MFKIFNNKIFLTLLTVIVGILIAIAVIFNKQSSQLPIVAIASWGPHVSLSETIVGIKEELYGVRFEVANANFDPSLIMQILYKLKSRKPKVIVAIATPVAQVAKNIIKDIPLVFANVTDPVGSGLLTKRYKSLDNLTGVSDMQDLRSFLSVVKKLLPNSRNIGILYSTTESNDAALVKMMKEAAKLYDMHVIAVAVDDINANDISISVQSLNNQVDFIYVGTSAVMQKSLPNIAAAADQIRVPVFNAHSEAVLNHQVLGSFGVNYRKVGHLVARAVKSVLNGGSIKSIKPVYPSAEDHQWFISKKRAKQYDIIVPTSGENDNITIVE